MNSDWDYTYFDFPKDQMVQQHLKAVSDLLFASNSRLFYIARQSSDNKKRIHGFIKVGNTWLTTSPTHGSQVPDDNQVEAAGALTYSPYDNRLYFVGVDGFLYYHTVLGDWTFTYNKVPQTALISQGIRIMPNQIAVLNNEIFYIGKEISYGNELRIHALSYSGTTWQTVSPTHSADIYNGQPLTSQVQSDGYNIAVSPNGKLIAYTGTDGKVYYYKDISGGWNFSYNKIKSTDYNPPINSLQYIDNQNLFFVCPIYDLKAHNIKLQESFCENPSIDAIEDGTKLIKDAYSAKIFLPQDSTEDIKYMKDCFEVFPNPATDKIELQFLKPIEKSTIVSYIITNSIGQKIIKGSLMSKSIDIHNLTSGVYFISLFCNKKNLGTRKFIVNK